MPITQFTDGVEIEGSQDITQLKVQGHSIQTEPLQTWQDSTETVQAQLTGDGRLQIGSFDENMMATDDALIEAHRDENATGKPKRGLHLLGEVTGVLDSLVSWAVQELVLKGSGGISALHSALRVRLTNENTGTMDVGADLRAADVEIVNNGGSSGNNVPELTGLRVAVTNQENGYAETAYGLKVEINDAGSLDQAYAIHTGQGIAHFGDFVELVTPTVVPGTPDTDIVRLYPKADGKLYAKNGAGEEYDLTGGGGGGSSVPLAGVCHGRLTLSSGVAVPTADVLAADMLYFTPFRGNQVALFDGVEWVLHPFSEHSLGLSALAANTLYDIFLYDDSGTLTLEAVAWNAPASSSITSISNASPRVVTSTAHGLSAGQLVTIAGNSVTSNNTTWRVGTTAANTFQLLNLNGTNSSSPGSVGTGGTWQRADTNSMRATSLALQDGVYVKSGVPERRYLGTIRTTSVAGRSEDSLTKRFVYNEYNAVPRKLRVLDLATWTYTTNAWRAAKNNLANRVEVVVGNEGPLTELQVGIRVIAAGPGVVHSIGLNRINGTDADILPSIENNGRTYAAMVHPQSVGYHFYQWVENGRGSSSGAMYGGVVQCGMVGTITV
jgi:hypothetical protein